MWDAARIPVKTRRTLNDLISLSGIFLCLMREIELNVVIEYPIETSGFFQRDIGMGEGVLGVG